METREVALPLRLTCSLRLRRVLGLGEARQVFAQELRNTPGKDGGLELMAVSNGDTSLLPLSVRGTEESPNPES